ncbi:hypothetical protein ABIB83_007505 [Bradyrhizobium sp. I1.8.5]|uniref:Uncharacterized protein n=1 Tax=Bradyrhizobium japonicum TaxID=375 RepID=A0A1Y2JRV0_BRAJP|nr:hypothetical protein [Bradyrhizobium japonicum]OSJ34216.1 hypothetical protein BSZ19_12800 [Bradyrhizobium japonicum]
MKANLLKATAAELTSLAAGTAADHFRDLQSGKLVSKGAPGRYGGVVMTDSDRINTLLGFAFDPPRGESRVANVKRIRRFELLSATYSPLRTKISPEDSARSAFQFVQGLTKFDDLGTALDGIVGSMRTSAFADWEAEIPADIVVDFHGDRSVTMMIDRPQTNNSAVFIFEPKKAPSNAAIERITRLHRIVFERLAANETAPDQD